MSERPSSGLAHEEITRSIIGAFFDSYNGLRDGFLESTYARALELELIERGLRVDREVGVQVVYKGEAIAWHRLDMVVESRVVVEIKAGAALPPHASRQLLNYLRATRLEVGLLLHYGPSPRFFREYAPNQSE